MDLTALNAEIEPEQFDRFKLHIDLTAYNSETEPHRIKRLELLVLMIKYHLHDVKAEWAIERLHDAKGQLSVFWRAPTTDRIGVVNHAWRFFNEWQVEHYFGHVLIATASDDKIL